MTWQIEDTARRVRVLIAVSKLDHCLQDLLFRWRSGVLPVDVVGVVSNHPDLRSLVEWHQIPFHHLPVTAETRRAAGSADSRADFAPPGRPAGAGAVHADPVERHCAAR